MKPTSTVAAFGAVIQIPDLGFQFVQIQRADLFRAALSTAACPLARRRFQRISVRELNPTWFARQAYDSVNLAFAFSIMATAWQMCSFFFRPVATGLGKFQLHQHIL